MTPKSPQEFAEAIRRKYPTGVASDGRSYADIDDTELTRRWVQANPEYKDQVEFPSVDLEKAMPGYQSVQSRLENAPTPKPEQKGFLGLDTDMSTTGLKERLGDVKETAQGMWGQMKSAGRDIIDTAKRDDRNLFEKANIIGGRTFQGVAGVIGEATIGAGKVALTQEAEDGVSRIAQKAAQGVADTEIAQDLAGWYNNLDPRTRDQVDAAGGYVSLLTELVGVKGAKVAGKPLQEGVEATVPAIRQGADAVTQTARQAGEAVVQKVDTMFVPSEAKLQSKVDTLFTKAVRPTMQGKQNIGQMEKAREQAVEAVRTINRNSPNLKYTDDLGQEITGRTPESLREFSQSIQQTKQDIYKQYNDLAKQAGDNGVTVNPNKFADEFDSFINDKAVQVAAPETIQYAKSMRERFGEIGDLAPEDIENVIKLYNQDLSTFYKNPTADQGRKIAVDAMIVNNLRKQLDEAISNSTGAEYQALKKQYGALRSIEKDVLNATIRDARKNVAGLIDFTDIFSGGQLAAGVISMNPAAIGGAAAQRGIKTYFKYLNDPNVQVKKMFQNAEKLEQTSFKTGANQTTKTPITPEQAPPTTAGVSTRNPITNKELRDKVEEKGIDFVSFSKEAKEIVEKAAQSEKYVHDQARAVVNATPNTTFAPGPLKKVERVIEKAAVEEGGDLTAIKDIARNTIIPLTPEAKSAATAKMLQRSDIARHKQQTPDKFLGYEGDIFNIKTPNGSIAETQIVSPQMTYGKNTEIFSRSVLGDDVFEKIKAQSNLPSGKGHDIYEQIRSLDKKAPDYLEKYGLLEAESIDYYNQLRNIKI